MDSIRSELNSLLVGDFRSRKSTSAGLLSILFHILCAIFAASFGIILAKKFPEYSYTIHFCSIFFIGTRWRALGNMMHECTHGIFVNNPVKNKFFGHLISAIEFSSFHDYMEQHLSHHGFLGDPERDLDYKSRRIFLAGSQFEMGHLLKLILAALSLVPLWKMMLRIVLWRKSCPAWTNFLRLTLMSMTIVLLVIPSTRSSALLFLIIPYVTVYQWLKILSDLSDHLYLYRHSNPLDRSRNHLLPSRILNWLVYPRHDAYHLLHHLFPTMPIHYYPLAHSRLLKNSWYNGKSHEWRFFPKNPMLITPETQGHSK